MRSLPNISSNWRMLFPSGSNKSLRLSVLGLAFSSALFWAVPSSADIAVLPEPYYTNGIVSVEAWCQLHAVTNHFMTLEDWRDYRDSLQFDIDEIYRNCLELEGEFSSIQSLVIQAVEDSMAAFDAWMDDFVNLQPSVVTDNLDWDQLIEVYHSFDIIWQGVDGVSAYVSQCQSFLDILEGNLSYLETHIRDLDDNFQEMVFVTDVEVGMEPYDGPFSGGGCDCPDYRPYLSYIQGQLDDLLTQALWLRSQCESALSAIASILNQYGYSTTAQNSLAHFSSIFTDLMAQLEAINLRRYEYLNPVGTNVLAHIMDGWVFPTNTAARPLYVTMDEDSPPLSVTLQQTNAIEVILSDDGTNWVNVANYEDLIDLLRELFEERDQNQADYSQDLEDQVEDDKGELRDFSDDATFSLDSPGNLEWFSFWGDFQHAFSRLSHSFPTPRDLDIRLSDPFSINLSGAEDGEIEFDDIIIPGAFNKSSTALDFLHRVSTFFWTALVLFLDLIIIRWVIVLVGNGLAFVTAILSGDMSGLAKIIPALSRAITGSD